MRVCQFRHSGLRCEKAMMSNCTPRRKRGRDIRIKPGMICPDDTGDTIAGFMSHQKNPPRRAIPPRRSLNFKSSGNARDC